MANVSYNAQQGGSLVTIRTIGNSTDVVVVGAPNASNITSNSTETVISAVISKVTYGCPANAYWSVYRGANIVGVFTGSGEYSHSLTTDPTANITANLVGGTTGILQMIVKKTSSFS